MSHVDDKQLQLNVSFNIIPKTKLAHFQQHFTGYKSGLVRSEPGKFVMSAAYGENAEKVYQFAPRADDVWLVTFPKCGTTWTSELLWLLMNDCDTEKAKSIPLNIRTPILEISYFDFGSDFVLPIRKTLKECEKMPSPRIFKTHIPFHLLHPSLLDTSKVVYVARNPKDAIVSYYFYHKSIKLHGFTGSIDEFAEYFMQDEVIYAPFFSHVLEAWSKRQNPNMHFMFFEDMKKDLRGEIEKVAGFLGKLLNEEQLSKITEHLRFDDFEKNESVNLERIKKLGLMSEDGKFIRKGKAGDWKNHFNPEMNTRIDNWIADNLKGTDLKFVMELEHQD